MQTDQRVLIRRHLEIRVEVLIIHHHDSCLDFCAVLDVPGTGTHHEHVMRSIVFRKFAKICGDPFFRPELHDELLGRREPFAVTLWIGVPVRDVARLDRRRGHHGRNHAVCFAKAEKRALNALLDFVYAAAGAGRLCIFVRLRVVQKDEVRPARIDVKSAYRLIRSTRCDDPAGIGIAVQLCETLEGIFRVFCDVRFLAEIRLHLAALRRERDIRERHGKLREVACEVRIFRAELPDFIDGNLRHRLCRRDNHDETPVAIDERPHGRNFEPRRLAFATRPADMPVAAEPNRLLERLDESDHARRRPPLEHLIRTVKVGQPELQKGETASPDAEGIFDERNLPNLTPFGAIPVRPLCRRQRKAPFL